MTVIDSTFAPPAPPSTDHLGDAVLRSLGRNYQSRFSIGLARGVIGALLTFGITPVLSLSRRFRDYVMFDRQHLWHLSEWLRLQTGRPEAVALRDLTHTIRHRDLISGLIKVCVILVIMGLVVAVSSQPSLHALIGYTWGASPAGTGSGISPAILKAFLVWNVGLSAAYLLQLAQVTLYRRDLGRFVDQFNRLALAERLPPVTRPQSCAPISIPWFGAAALMMLNGGLWAIPFAVVAVFQRHYINTSAAVVRAQIADRVRIIRARTRPAPRQLDYNLHAPVCTNTLCTAHLPGGAAFCPRCGTRNLSFQAVV